MQLYRDKFNCFVEVVVEGVDCKASLALTFAVIFQFNLFKTKSGRGLIRPAQSIDPNVRKTSVKKRGKREKRKLLPFCLCRIRNFLTER